MSPGAQGRPWVLLLSLSLGCSGRERLVDAGVEGAADAFAPPDAGRVESVVPAETADREALAQLADWRALPVLGQGRTREQSSHDRGAGTPTPLPILANGNRDANNFVCPGRTEALEEPGLAYVFDQETCAEDFALGLVMARFEGSGTMTRLWLTALALLGGDRWGDEELRVYVDDRPEPLLRAPVRSLLRGTTEEIFAPPFGASSASHLAWHYPVVFGSKLLVTLDRLDPLKIYWHQTDVVLDPLGAPRAPAATRLPERDQAASLLESTDDPLSPLLPLIDETAVLLEPGATVVVADLPGPATVYELRVEVPVDSLPDRLDVDLAVTWEDEAEPAIEVPVQDLLGITGGSPPPAGLALSGSNAGGVVTLRLRLPMPFSTRAVWTLHNRGTLAESITLALEGREELPQGTWGHLRVEHHVTGAPAATTYHPLARLVGPGRLVGVCMSMTGHAIDDLGPLSVSPYNFLEGDERGVIDGELVLEGTGTEDYFDSSFYFGDGPFSTAFAQAWSIGESDESPPHGRASACRWHVLTNAIDYQESLDLDLEIGPATPAALDEYRSVAFFYRQD